MDPLPLIIGIGLLVIVVWLAGRRRAGAGRTYTLANVPECRVSPEEEERAAERRNLIFRQIEEQARMTEHVTGDSLYGKRMAALQGLVTTTRRPNDGGPLEGPM